MILVTGSIVARADTFDALLAESLAHVQRSRTEPGCISHAVHRDVENPLRLVFAEQWTDKAALAAHFAVPASGEFVRTVRELTAERPEMHIYDAVAVPFPLT
jgi:quinol monooxygenase YgiN